jgi:hypothetical protein
MVNIFRYFKNFIEGRMGGDKKKQENRPLVFDSHLLIPSFISILKICFAVSILLLVFYSGALIESDIQAHANASFDPTSHDWSNQDISVAITATREWRFRRYHETDNSYSSWSSWLASGTRSFNFTNNGIHRFEVQVRRADGTINTVWSGRYRIDKNSPNITFRPNSSSWTNSLTVSIDTNDGNLSGVKERRHRVSSNNGSTWGSWTAWSTSDQTRSFSNTNTYKIEAQARDNAGNVTTLISGSYQIDSTNPTAPTINMDENWINGDRYFNITGGSDADSGLNRRQYSFNNSNWTTVASGTNVLARDTSGTTTVYARTVDNAGNISSVVSKVARVDKTAPTAPTINMDESWINGDRYFSLSGGSDAHSGFNRLQYSFNNSTWTNYPGGNILARNTSGTTTVYARTVDNVSIVSGVVSKVARVDKTAPTAPTINMDESWINGDRYFSLSGGSDAHSGFNRLQYSFNNSTWTNYPGGNILARNTSGTTTVYARTVDNVNIVSSVVSKVASVDKTAPTAPTINMDESWINGDRYFSLSGGSDAHSGFNRLQYSFNNSTWTNYPGGNILARNTSGTTTVYARTVDNVSIVSSVVSKVASVDKTAPTAPTINMDESWINGDRYFSLSGGSDAHSGFNRLQYSFNNSTWTNYPGGNILARNTSGTTTVYARTVDNVSIVSSVVSKVARVDKTAPTGGSLSTSPVGSNGNYYNVTTIRFSINASDADSGIDQVRFPTWTTANGQDDLIWHVGTHLGNGVYQYDVKTSEHNNETGAYTTHIYAYDNAGNNALIGTMNYTIDTTPPTAPTINMDESWINGDRYFNITGGSDAHSGLNRHQYSFDNSTWTTVGAGTNVLARSTSGTSTVYARTVDNAENISSVVSKVARVDKTAPNTFTPTATVNSSTQITIQGTTTDDHSGLHSSPYAFSQNNGSGYTVYGSNSSYSFTELSPNTSYVFRMKAKDALNIERISNSVTQITFANVPSIGVGGATTNSISVTIDPNENPSTTEYYVQRSTTSNFSSGNTVIRNWVTGTTFTDTGLTPNVRYYYRVKARNGNNVETAYSSIVNEITPKGTQGTPLNIIFDVPTYGSSQSISWGRMDTASSGYEVQISRNGGAWVDYDLNVAQPTSGNPSLSIPASEFNSMGTRRFRIRAKENENYYASAYGESNTRTVAQKAITGSFTANNKVYNGTTAATVATRSLTGVLAGDTVTLTGGTATFDTATVGTGKTVTLTGATLTGTHAANYTLSSVSTTTANITAKAVTVTAEAKSKVYGAGDPVLTYTTSGLVGGDTISGALARNVGENVGTYAITQGTVSVGSNYTITYVGANLTITKAAQAAPASVTFIHPATFGQERKLTWSRVETASNGYLVERSSDGGTTWTTHNSNVAQPALGNPEISLSGTLYQNISSLMLRVSANTTSNYLQSLPTNSSNLTDLIAPTVTFSPFERDWSNTPSVTVTPSDTGGSGVYRWRWSARNNGGAWWNSPDWFTDSHSITLGTEGLRELKVEIFDNAGNVNELISGVYKVDNTAPTIDSLTQNPLAGTWTNNDVEVTASISDLGGSGISHKRYAAGNQNVAFFNNGSGGFALSAEDQFSVSENGVYTVYARDHAGNETVGNINITNMDKTPPAEFTPTATADSSTQITITGSTTDAESGMNAAAYRFRVGENSYTNWQEGTSYQFTGLTLGTTYSFNMEARDNVGNIRTSGVVTATTSKENQNAPANITFEVPTYGSYQTLSWNKLETANEGYEVEINRGDGFVPYSDSVSQSNVDTVSIIIPASEFSTMGTRQFRVRAKETNTHNESLYSETEIREVQKAPQDTPIATLYDLIDGVNGTLMWTNMDTANQGYRLKVYRNRDGNQETIVNIEGSNTSYSLSNTLFNAGDGIFFEVQAKETSTHMESLWVQSVEKMVRYPGVIDGGRIVYDGDWENALQTATFNGEEENYKETIGDYVVFGGITWRIIHTEGSQALLFSEEIIDMREFDDDRTNDWQSSDIHAWLNADNGFLDSFQDVKDVIVDHQYTALLSRYNLPPGNSSYVTSYVRGPAEIKLGESFRGNFARNPQFTTGDISRVEFMTSLKEQAKTDKIAAGILEILTEQEEPATNQEFIKAINELINDETLIQKIVNSKFNGNENEFKEQLGVVENN